MLEPELHYFCKPGELRPVARPVEFVTAQEFVADEPACKTLWELVSTQFRTRGKFLAVWPGVRFVALHRDPDGRADGFLLVNAPINWQIDYVVVAPEARGQGIASALVVETANQAFLRGVPYVMLTSKASLRPLYEACGFVPVGEPTPPAPLPAGRGETSAREPFGASETLSAREGSVSPLPAGRGAGGVGPRRAPEPQAGAEVAPPRNGTPG